MTLSVKVEIAFATDPDDTSPAWTDVSAYVDVASATVDVTRGRGDQYSNVQPSTAAFTLDNSDGRFTPGYASSPYYPNVVLGKRVRISFRKGVGTWRPRFDGFIDSWPTSWEPTGRLATAAVTAVDRLNRLGRGKVADNLLVKSFKDSNPVNYWTLGDDSAATAPANTVGAMTLVASPAGALTFGDAIGVPTDGLTAGRLADGILFTGGTQQYFAFSSTQSFSFECFYTAAAGGANLLFYGAPLGSSDNLFIRANDGIANQVTAQFLPNAGTGGTATNTAVVNDGKLHHIAVVCNGPAATVTVYVDGVAGTPVSMTFGTPSSVDPIYEVGNALHSTSYTDFTLAHVALYASALSAGEIAKRTVLAGLSTADDSAARWARVADIAGIPSAFVATVGAPGTVSMGALDVQGDGRTYEDLLEATAALESGTMFVSTTGVLTLQMRTVRYNQVPVATLALDDYEADLTFLLDYKGLVNDFTTTDGHGDQHRYVDAASIVANGLYNDDVTLDLMDPAQAEAYSQMRVTTAQPAPRISTFTAQLLANETLADTLWQSELLGQSVVISGLPSTAPATSVTVEIQGYTESFSPLSGYTLQANTTPALAAVWKLGDAVLGVLGSTTRLAY
ncbi:LamG-like jellyroll fold domain-containing protein [Angustibacter luteus]|uniref:LamG-like jellyroll fold domain-containing protein n=1 Tax=Angustibacter luteus TaxID=658456 RepID=A0ABW1JJB4_9ACTN